MRVLALCRLFSGFTECLQSRQWRPSGAPAIARVLEGLHADEGVDLHTVFAVKDHPLRELFPKSAQFELDEIGPVEIWPAPRTGTRRLAVLATELDHLQRAIRLCLRLQPDVVYATYGQITAAAAIAHMRLAPVVLRMMGIFPHHRELVERKISIGKRLLRAPFAHVICTQEGSDPEKVLAPLVRSGVSQSILLNGVDRSRPAPEAVDRIRKRYGLGNRPIVLFVGRLEVYKGCMEFVDAATQFIASGAADADFVLVGDGSCRKLLEGRCAKRGLGGHIHLIGSVRGDEVATWLAAADIYVSLNRHGNLSNANLEALAMGSCMIIPGSDRSAGIDASTDALLPADVVVRYEPSEPVESLAAILGELLPDRQRIAALGAAARRHAEKSLVSWPQRVAREIEIIRNARTAGNSP